MKKILVFLPLFLLSVLQINAQSSDCSTPGDLSANNITSFSADLKWAGGGVFTLEVALANSDN
jgi:hypothetical protein